MQTIASIRSKTKVILLLLLFLFVSGFFLVSCDGGDEDKNVDNGGQGPNDCPECPDGGENPSTPFLSIDAVVGSAIEASSDATFTVALGSKPTAEVSISIEPQNLGQPSRVTVDPENLTFTMMNWDKEQTVTVSAVDNDIDETDTTIQINLDPSSKDEGYDILPNGIAYVSVIDDDTAGFVASELSGNLSEAGDSATFTLRLASQPKSDIVQVQIVSGDTSEASIDPSLIEFDTTTWNTDQTITVTGLDDDVADGSQSFEVSYMITSASFAPAYKNLPNGSVTATNADDDTAGVTVGAASGNTTEAAGTATFDVRLNTMPTNDVQIDLSSSDIGEGTVSPSSLTFTFTDWNRDQTVTVTGVDDSVVDSTVDFQIEFDLSSSTDPLYADLTTDSLTISNDDDDVLEFSLFEFLTTDNVGLSADSTGSIGGTSGDLIYVPVPYLTSLTSLVASWDTTATTVEVSASEQTSGISGQDFSSPVTYDLTGEDGSTQSYSVIVEPEVENLAYVKAANADAGDRFGQVLDISGDTLVVGAPYESSNQTTITNDATADSDNSTFNSGAVYVYVRSGDTWTQQAYIKAPNNGVSDLFGYSVAIDGDTLVVGTPFEDSGQTTITNDTTADADNSVSSSGAVYVFVRSGTTWTQEAYIKAPNAETLDYFGYSVALSGDSLVVGAYLEDSNQTTITNGTSASSDNSATDAGAAYVFVRNGTTWTQEAYLKAPNAETEDYFGTSVSIVGDTIAVGAWGEDSTTDGIINGTTISDNNGGSAVGAVYIFSRSGTTWSHQAYLKAGTPITNDYFGTQISLSGERIAVGTLGSNKVYTFVRSSSEWSPETIISGAESDAQDDFGGTVSLDGDHLLVGARNEDSSQTTISQGVAGSTDDSLIKSGAAYLFVRHGSSWIQKAYLKAPNADADDIFGLRVSLSGNTAAIGAREEDSNQTTITNGTTASSDNSAAAAGAVYLFE